MNILGILVEFELLEKVIKGVVGLVTAVGLVWGIVGWLFQKFHKKIAHPEATHKGTHELAKNKHLKKHASLILTIIDIYTFKRRTKAYVEHFKNTASSVGSYFLFLKHYQGEDVKFSRKIAMNHLLQAIKILPIIQRKENSEAAYRLGVFYKFGDNKLKESQLITRKHMNFLCDQLITRKQSQSLTIP